MKLTGILANKYLKLDENNNITGVDIEGGSGTTYSATTPITINDTVISIHPDTLTAWRTKQNQGATAHGWGNHASAGYELAANKFNATSTSTTKYPTWYAAKHYADSVAASKVYSQWLTTGSNISFTGGYVGVGKTNPTAALDVATDIKANGVTVGQGAYVGNNLAFGIGALGANRAGTYNIALGASSLATNDQGNYNTGIGVNALYNLYDGNANVAIGTRALYACSMGDSSVAIGYEAGRYMNLGAQMDPDHSIYIGSSAKGSDFYPVNEIVIGCNAVGNGSNTATFGNSGTEKTVLNGVVEVGKVNRITLDSAYGLMMYGTTKVWDDVSIGGTALGSGPTAPNLRTFVGGIQRYAYQPSSQNDVSYFDAQLRHQYAEGDTIEFHLHLSPEATPTAGDTAVFEFEYSWQNIGGGAFPSPTVVTKKIPLNGMTALGHYLVEVTRIPGAGKTFSSMLVCRLQRMATHASDTYDGANDYIFVFNSDFHCPINRLGTPREASNNP